MRTARRLAGAGLALLLIATAPVLAEDAMLHEPLARLQGLDKITARSFDFTAPVGTPVRFRRLQILVRDCETNPPEDPPESAAFVQITGPGRGGAKTRLFSGWMFASSPALSALQDPVYDVELLACTAASASSPENSAAGKAAEPAKASPSNRR